MSADDIMQAKFRERLIALAPEARHHLQRQIERAKAAGSAGPDMDVVLQVLISLNRDAENRVERSNHLARNFFRIADPFIIDEVTETKIRGRICRPSLMPIWEALERRLLADEVGAAHAAFDKAYAAGNDAECARIVGELHAAAVEKLSALVVRQADESDYRHLISELGSERAYEELRDLVLIIRCREPLAAVSSLLPAQIKNLNADNLNNCRAILERPAFRNSEAFPFGIALLTSRFVNSGLMVRFAARVAGTDEPAKLLDSVYARGIELAVDDLERFVIRARNALKNGALRKVEAPIKDFHDTVRALRTEMDLSGDSRWGRRISKLRAELSGLVSHDLESLSGRVRRVLRERGKDEMVEAFDPYEIAEIEAWLDLLGLCRACASEIALNDITTRITSDLQTYLERQTPHLLDAVRVCNIDSRAGRVQQLDAAVRFSGRIFGPSYAQLLQKAVDVAVAGERRAAR